MPTEIRASIVLRSELNPWIDLCIIPYEDFLLVKEVAEKAYDNWWDEEPNEPIGDYIQRKLNEAGCCYEMYYAIEQEDLG